MSDTFVRDQYESYPYPPRRPDDERQRLLTGSPSQIDELNHYVFGGARDFSRPFRALMAGGGTGDGTLMLAQQLADRGGPAEVVYVDLSTASRDIAEARAKVRGLTNVRFEHMSLLDLPDSGLGPFDYVDCCGVLHHLEDPDAGLQALARVTAADGGLGIMLYGELGRSGVYAMQDMLRMLATAETAPAQERLDLTRRLLGCLPRGNLLRRNPYVTDHLENDDAHLFDLFLHARDHAYRVPEIAAMAGRAGLRVVAFVPEALYDPATSITDPKLSARTQKLEPLQRAAFAELLAGSLRKHIFYLVKADNDVTPPDPRDPDAIPVLVDMDGAAFARDFRPGSMMSMTVEGVDYRRPLPDLTGAIVPRIDGRTTLQDLHTAIETEVRRIPWPAFADRFAALYAVLNGLGKMMLRRAGC